MSTHINGRRPTGLEIFNKIAGRKASRLFVKGSPTQIELLGKRLGAPPFNLHITSEPRETRGSIIRLSDLDGKTLMDAAHIVMSDDFRLLEVTTDEIPP